MPAGSSLYIGSCRERFQAVDDVTCNTRSLWCCSFRRASDAANAERNSEDGTRIYYRQSSAAFGPIGVNLRRRRPDSLSSEDSLSPDRPGYVHSFLGLLVWKLKLLNRRHVLNIYRCLYIPRRKTALADNFCDGGPKEKDEQTYVKYTLVFLKKKKESLRE